MNRKPPTLSHTKTKTNLRAGIRGNYRSETEEIRLKNEIFSLSDNHTDYEIMSILKMPNSTYYRYKQKLYEEAREIWRHTYKDSETYRAVHTMNSINLALRTHKEIILDKTQSAKDRMEACGNLVDAEMNYLHLLSEINDDNDTTPVSVPTPRPVDFPTVLDPNTGKWITDPDWIRSNAERVMKEGNYRP